MLYLNNTVKTQPLFKLYAAPFKPQFNNHHYITPIIADNLNTASSQPVTVIIVIHVSILWANIHTMQMIQVVNASHLFMTTKLATSTP